MGVSTRTIQRWDKQGLIKTVRTPKGRRRIPMSEARRILRQITNDRKAVIYARVSSQKQNKDGSLEKQIERLLKWAKENNYEVVRVFKDTGEYLSVKETAEIVNLSERQVQRLIKKGELIKEGKEIPLWSIYAFLKRGYEIIYECE